MPEVELLDKTEVWVRGAQLRGVDLRLLAASAAEVLGLPDHSVFVTDVRDGHVVFDVLQPRVDLAKIVGHQRILLDALARVPGVSVLPDASVHSRGVMGMLGAPADTRERVLAEAEEAEGRLRGYVSSRVAVVSTGAEVLAGEIVDTNVLAAAEILGAAGFGVTAAGIAVDDEDAILGRVLRLASEGYGVVLTTGGVGAEDKDRTIEALQRCDPDLSTAVVTSYPVGHGRHVKPHVRTAVGQVGWARVIALPGPTHEVRVALALVIRGLREGWSDRRFAESIASVLRQCYSPK